MAGCLLQTAASSSSSRWRLLLVTLLLLAVVVVVAPTRCEASRGMQPFRGKPLDRGSSNNFFGFLPRGPIPPSGPSRQHNAIGAEDQGNP